MKSRIVYEFQSSLMTESDSISGPFDRTESSTAIDGLRKVAAGFTPYDGPFPNNTSTR